MSQDSLILAADSGRLPVTASTTRSWRSTSLVVIGIGVMARRAIATSEDFLLSGRSLPAWITGLAFISANLGAIEILGMAANGAQYGIATVHFYWIGAVPAMVFLGLVMMPFYYGSGCTASRTTCAAGTTTRRTCSTRWTFAAGLGAHRRGQPVRAGPGHPEPARLADLGVDRHLGRLRARVHHARRPVRRDLQRGAAVLRHPRRPHPDRDRRACQGRRLERPEGHDRVEERRRRGRCSASGAASASATRPTRSATGSASSSASASCSRSATGRRTSPRCSGRCRPRTCPPAQRTPLIGAFPKIFIPA